MPLRARWWTGVFPSGEPSKLMLPWRGGRMPITERISVVLPAPLRPIRPTNSPVGTSMFTPRRMPTDAIDTSRPSMRSMMSSGRSVRSFASNVFADFDIAQHRGRQPIGNDAAFIEGQHALGIAGDDVHVVFDEQHRHLLRTYRFYHHVHQHEFLVRRYAGRRFIEQQDFRFHRHRHCDIQQFTYAFG